MIPTTRTQALSLLAAVDWEPERLTADQIRAIRNLYNLDEPVPLPRGARYLTDKENGIKTEDSP